MNKFKNFIILLLIAIALILSQIMVYLNDKEKEIKIEDNIKKLQEWQDSVEKNAINLR